MQIKWKFWQRSTPSSTPIQDHGAEKWMLVAIIIFLGILIGGPVRRILGNVPWVTVAIWLLIALVVIGLAYFLWQKPEWRRASARKWKVILGVAVALLLTWFIISKVSAYRAGEEKALEARAKADALWDKSVSERGLYLEDTSYVFTTTIDTSWSSVFIARKDYCFRTEPLDPSKGYFYAMHHDTLKVVADIPIYGITHNGTPKVIPELAMSMPFTLRAYGSPRSTVVIWHEKVDSTGACPTKHLKLPVYKLPEVPRLSIR